MVLNIVLIGCIFIAGIGTKSEVKHMSNAAPVGVQSSPCTFPPYMGNNSC